MSTAITKIDRGVTTRTEFSGSEIQKTADMAVAAVTARERAIVEAQYLVAERHPRDWMDVRAAMLTHCARPRFAGVCRYAKPVGKKKVNGQWVEEFAKGFTVRFAEVLTQEAGNIKPDTAVTFEDDLIRIVRISVTDLQRNICRSREVTIAKAVEKRGKEKDGLWFPPEGREVISQRINSYGDPVFLVKATDDELRNRVNSEESKTQRDFVFKLCPRDILEDCEDAVTETLAKEDKRDPQAATKKLLDRFQEFGLMPSDLQTYIGRPVAQWTENDRRTLIELGGAIRDGQTTFDEALKARYTTPDDEGEAGTGGAETTQQHDARLKRQAENQLMTAQEKAAQNKLATLTQGGTVGSKVTQADVDKAAAEHKAKQAEQPPDPNRELTAEESRALDAEIAAKEAGGEQPKPAGSRKKLF